MPWKKAQGRTKKSSRTPSGSRTLIDQSVKARISTVRTPRNNKRAKWARRHSLLILECDTAKLQAQNLSVADTIRSALGVLSSSDNVVTICTTSEAQLLVDFQRVVEAKTLFDS